MKKAQQGIGLVILGVVAIIAVIGLVLLFTRASVQKEGSTGLSIGNLYGNNNGGAGIVSSASSGYSSWGTRLPTFIVSTQIDASGSGPFEGVSPCEKDITQGKFDGLRSGQFNCYAVPNPGMVKQGVLGHYPPQSYGQSRAPGSLVAKTGGDLYCYRNSIGREQQSPQAEEELRSRILDTLSNQQVAGTTYAWSEVEISGVRVPVCLVGSKGFPFAQ